MRLNTKGRKKAIKGEKGVKSLRSVAQTQECHSRRFYRESSSCKFNKLWIPAFAGMTAQHEEYALGNSPKRFDPLTTFDPYTFTHYLGLHYPPWVFI